VRRLGNIRVPNRWSHLIEENARKIKSLSMILHRGAPAARMIRTRNNQPVDEAPMSVALTTAQALTLWQNVALAMVQDDEPDLSVRQMSILLIIYLEAPPHTVRDLAKKLGVTKPVITRALDTMGKLELVSRRRDEKDRRNVLIQRTVKGALYLERLADTIGKFSAKL
jgi:DNA-binding MarR family transcriptional regulator